MRWVSISIIQLWGLCSSIGISLGEFQGRVRLMKARIDERSAECIATDYEVRRLGMNENVRLECAVETDEAHGS